MSDGITWHNGTRKLCNLVPWPSNPREITIESAKRLADSLKEYGQVHAIAIEPDNEIVDGHQRREVWAASVWFGPDYEVDVRVASRKLTEEEKRRLSVLLHKGAYGVFDFEVLANWAMEDELLEWGFEEWELGIDTTEEVPTLDTMYRLVVEGLDLDEAAQLRDVVTPLTPQEARIEQYTT